MDTSEILRMLLESQAATDKAAQHVVDTLFSMDTVSSHIVYLRTVKPWLGR